MFFKICVSFTIIILSVGIGNVAGKKFSNRVDDIESMITGIKLLESCIMYTYDPIPKAMESISRKTSGIASIFFGEIARRLSGEYVADFQALWNETTDTVLGESALTDKEISIIKSFGAGFGSTDATNQKSLFLHTYQLLEMQLLEAETEKAQKPKVYQGLATATGLLIVILLI